ncbi:MAG TPA: serine hydrolase [Terriglobales bacterium]|nr:serine hydrolase [Terriglobales bacterium]
METVLRWAKLACLAAALLALPPSSRAEDSLQRRLEAMAKAHAGGVALYAKHLKTGQVVALDADRPVPTASVIKLPILLEAFAQVKAGRRSLQDRLVLNEENKVPGSGVLTLLHTGLEVTLEDALVLMIVLSDNTATNLVIDRVGIPAVNERMAGMGLKNTYLYKKVYRPAQGQVPEDQKQFGLGKTTAREMAAVMESVARCELGDAALCRRMIEMLQKQQYRNMIPRYLETVDTSEEASAVADKVGQLDDVRNDVALVHTTTGPVVISVFTYGNQDRSWTPDNQAEMLVARMAEAIVKAWAPKGVGTEKPTSENK